MSKIQHIFTILLCILPSALFSQESGSVNPFQTEPAVYQNKKEHVEITIENGEVQINSKTELEKLLQIDKGDSWTDEYIFYSSFVEISDIQAELLIPNKKRFKSYPPTKMVLQERYNGGTFYDDGKLQKLIFPKAPKESRIKVSYREKLTTPDLFGSYFFTSYIPVLHSEFSISFPEEIEISYKLFNGEKTKINFSETKKKKITTYTWTSENVQSYRDDYKDFSINYYEPHLMLAIKSINKKPCISDYKDLYKRYMKIIHNPYPPIDPIFKPLVDSLCKNAKNDIEKLETIYYYIQSTIQYVAIEDGFAGLIPEKSINVLNKKFGDCKGKSNLLVTMLRQANIKAWLTWVGSRRRPYKYSDFPSAYIDDHMIVTAQIDGKDYSLDATDMFLHYTFPSQFTQGKESMVGIDSTDCRIFNIPIVAFDKNIFDDKLTFTIQHDSLTGSGKALLTGYYKNDLTTSLIRYTEQKNNDTYKKWFLKKQEKAKLDTAYSKNLESRIDTLQVFYKLTLPGHVKTYGDNIYVNLNIEKKYQNGTIDTAAFIYNKYLDYGYIESWDYTLNIPAGYSVESVPANISTVYENFGFNISYTNSGNSVTMKEKIYVTKPFIDISDFQKWNQMIKDINKAYNQTISLKRTGNENKK